MKRRAAFVFCFLLPAALFLRAQNAGQDADQNPAVPTITYERIWEAYTPQDIRISVQSTGSTRYLSRNPVKPPDQAAPDPDFSLEFTMSQANRDKLFAYAKQANYFKGDFTYKKHAVATTGKKTLIYADQSRHFETAYDYSENKPIQEITNLFQGISNTIEHGRKLQHLRRYDRLGLEAELQSMENAVAGHNLRELELIAPTLRSIAEDKAILNIARQRAQRLLAKSSSE